MKQWDEGKDYILKLANLTAMFCSLVSFHSLCLAKFGTEQLHESVSLFLPQSEEFQYDSNSATVCEQC